MGRFLPPWQPLLTLRRLPVLAVPPPHAIRRNVRRPLRGAASSAGCPNRHCGRPEEKKAEGTDNERRTESGRQPQYPRSNRREQHYANHQSFGLGTHPRLVYGASNLTFTELHLENGRGLHTSELSGRLALLRSLTHNYDRAGYGGACQEGLADTHRGTVRRSDTSEVSLVLHLVPLAVRDREEPDVVFDPSIIHGLREWLRDLPDNDAGTNLDLNKVKYSKGR